MENRYEENRYLSVVQALFDQFRRRQLTYREMLFEVAEVTAQARVQAREVGPLIALMAQDRGE